MSHDRIIEFRLALQTLLLEFEIQDLASSQLDRLAKHYSMILDWNRHINLTRIVKPYDAARFHYAESLLAGRLIDNDIRTLDIGSGAGFPAVPLAITIPNLNITALEANQKKALFLAEVKEALGLKNLEVVRARIEEIDLNKYGQFTSRALDRSDTVLLPAIRGLQRNQRLLLFCSQTLIDRFRTRLDQVYKIDIHPIPLSNDRFIAVFTRE